MTPPAPSLERRLIQRLTLILSASFVLFAVVYTFIIQNDAHFHAAEEVGEMARDLAGAIRAVPAGGHAFDAKAAASLADWPSGTAYAAVELPGEIPVAGSDAALLARLVSRPAAQFSNAEAVENRSGLDVLAVERVDVGGSRYRIAALRPMTREGIAVIGLEHEFTEEILPCFLPALLLAIVVTWITIRRNLRPLRRASREAASVSVDNPGQRMSEDGMVSEIKPMIRAVNGALERLETGIEAQKRFTANAAHELRTPLAVLRARVDSLTQGPERDRLGRDIDRLSRAVSQMLLSARLQSHQIGVVAPLALAPLVRDVVADLAPLAQANGRDLQLETLSRPHVVGSAPALESAVRNLIENALRLSPPDETVSVTVGPGARVTVEDRGPGVPEADRQNIFEPFWRAAGQPADGAGLGLAIVREVAELHHGTIGVSARPGGGACFVLDLGDVPAAPSAPQDRVRSAPPVKAPAATLVA